jgi:hypothetical protein
MYNKKSLRYYPVSFLLVAFLACNPYTKKTDDDFSKDERSELFNQNKLRNTFSITTPAGWQRTDTMINGIDIAQFTPPIDTLDTLGVGNPTNAVVAAIAVPDYYDLSFFYTKSLQDMQKTLKDFSIFKEGKAPINGEPTKWIQYTNSLDSRQMDVLQYYLVKNNTAYIITCGANVNEMGLYLKVFQQFVNTMRIKE